MLKTELFCLLTGVTPGEMEGMLIGLADGDLTIAEIEEAIEANGPLGPNDVVLSEQSMRPVWLLGGVQAQAASQSEVTMSNETGGLKIVAKPRWTFARTKSWNWFLYNIGAAPLTGAVAKVFAKSFGVWVT